VRKVLSILVVVGFIFLVSACNPMANMSPAERLRDYLTRLENQAPEFVPIVLDEPLEISEDDWYEKSLLEGRQTFESVDRKIFKDALRYKNHEVLSRLSESLSCVPWEAETGVIAFQHQGDPGVETVCLLAFAITVENGTQTSLTISIASESSESRYTFDLTSESKLSLDVETIETLPEDESESFFKHYRYREDELIFSLTQSDQNLDFHKLNLKTGDSVSLTLNDGILLSAKWYFETKNIIVDRVYGSDYSILLIAFFDADDFLSIYRFIEGEISSQIALRYSLAQLDNWDRMYLGRLSPPSKGLYAFDDFLVGNSGIATDATNRLISTVFETEMFYFIVNYNDATLTASMFDVAPFGLAFTHAQWNPSAIEAISDKTEDPASLLKEYADLVTLSQIDEPSFSFGRVPF
jgi:hypothetical protein